MEPDLRDYIRGVYQSLTEIGAEAERTIDSRLAAGSPKTTTTSAPAVKVTQPTTPAPTSTRPSAPRAVRPAASAAAALPIWNPFPVVAAGLRVIVQNRAHAFWLGLLVVAPSAIMSNALILDNLQRGSREFDRGPLPAIALAVAVYLLCWWIRVARTGTVTAASKPKFADVIAAAAIGIAAYVLWPLVYPNGDLPLTVRWAASLTRYWPLHGLYASMIIAPVLPSFMTVPPGTSFVEPFTYAASLIPAFPLVPFIVGEKVPVGQKLGHLLLRTPFLLAALALCTLPIAILNASLADWALGLVRSRNTLPVAIVTAVIFYVQLLVSATTIGEFYRRVAASHP
jgi:hypothetical protein